MTVVPPAIVEAFFGFNPTRLWPWPSRGERLIIESPRKPHYTLFDELLAQCDTKAPHWQEDREWL